MATTFEAPEGYKMPEGIEVGDEFEEVCTLKFTGDGKTVRVLAVDGNTLGKAEEKERKGGKPKGMMERMREREHEMMEED